MSSKVKRRFILLLISVTLVLSVCFSATLAWFKSVKTNDVYVAMNVLKFDFKTNNTYTSNLTVSNFTVYDHNGSALTSPVGIAPGYYGYATVLLKNTSSTGVVAKYNVKPTAITAPSGMYFTFGTSQAYASNTTCSLNTNVFSSDQSLNSNASKTYYLCFYWPYGSNSTSDNSFAAAGTNVSVSLNISAYQA